MDITAFTYIADRPVVDPEDLSAIEKPVAEAVSMQTSLSLPQVASLASTFTARSLASVASEAAAHINPAVKAYVGRNATKVSVTQSSAAPVSESCDARIGNN